MRGRIKEADKKRYLKVKSIWGGGGEEDRKKRERHTHTHTKQSTERKKGSTGETQ